MNGAALLLLLLREQGVETIFGYPGGAVLPIYDALGHDGRIHHVMACHEQGAIHAADGYARATGRTGVCLATSGPGATNLVTGIACAWMDSVPLVALTGSVPADMVGSDSFQEIDIAGITMPVTKHNYVVRDVSALTDVIREAFAVARAGRPGPVLVDISLTAQTADAEPHPLCPARTPGTPPAPDLSRAGDALALLRDARRPLLYAGGGVVSSGAAPLLQAFCEKTGLPVVTSMMGLTALPRAHPSHLGFAGHYGHAAAARALADCDALLALGTRFSERATGDRDAFSRNKRILHVDVDPAELNKNIQNVTGIVSDIPVFLKALLHLHGENGQFAGVTPSALPSNPAPEEAAARDIIRTVHALLPEEAVIVTDVGSHQIWTARHYNFVRPRSFLTSGGLGAMGFGLGAAIGASIGLGGAPAVLFTGDGSFHMNMNELAVAVTQRLPVIVVVLNNGVLGMLRTLGMRHETEPRRRTDFAAFARALGALGARCETPVQIREAVRTALHDGLPCVIDCPLAP